MSLQSPAALHEPYLDNIPDAAFQGMKGLPMLHALEPQVRSWAGEQAATILINLMSHRSDTSEVKVMQYVKDSIAALLNKTPAEISITQIPILEERHNLLISIGRPEIILSTHLDVVKAPDRLFLPFRKDDVIYGRGACDAKGSAASMIVAARILLERGINNIALLFLAGEESDHCGARAAVHHFNGAKELPKLIINGEPTCGKLVVAQLGSIGFELTVPGKKMHSAYAEFGVDANRRTVDMCSKLYGLVESGTVPADSKFGPALINIGQIDSKNNNSGVVCDETYFRFMLRSTSPTAEVRAHVNRIVQESDASFIGRAVQSGAIEASEAASFKTQATELYALEAWSESLRLPGWGPHTVRYGTDLAFLKECAAACLLYGPGTIEVAHGDDEHIAVADLADAVDGYVRLVELFKRINSL